MNWLEWLLGLDQVRVARDAPLILHWNTQLPAWLLFTLSLLSVLGIALIYRVERVGPIRRAVLATIRCGLAAVVIAILCQPTLILQRNRVEPSHVAFLLDTSASMNLREGYADATLAGHVARGAGLETPSGLSRHNRFDLVRRALLRDGAEPLQALLKRNGIQPMYFSTTVDPAGLISSAADLEAWAAWLKGMRPEGTGTDIAAALARALDTGGGRRLAAIVLASDGQATQPTPLKDVLDLAADRQVPVYPLRIGSPDPRLDLELSSATAPDHVFVNDAWVVEVKATARGLTEARGAEVRLLDAQSGETKAVAIADLTPTENSVNVELKLRPDRTGLQTYRIEAAAWPTEATLLNNVEQVSVVVLDNRVRVLFVDGYPRYEYRYLKNALIREPTVEVSVLLLEADEEFVQEGTDPIRRFPETPEELQAYDVVLFGDVDPRSGWLTTSQMNMLVDFVGSGGGGFALIAGERAAPHRYIDTPLEKLLPVRVDPTFLGHYEGTLVTGYRARLTPEGRRSRVFRWSPDRTETERLFESRAELYWIARTRGAKPGATVLAEHPTLGTAAGPMPLVVTGRYGAGRLFFQATDDTWRWRRHTGEFFHDAYWVQVVRELMPVSKFAKDRRYALRTDRRVVPYGVPVRVQVELFDADLLSESKDAVEVLVRNRDPGGGADSAEGATLAPSEEVPVEPIPPAEATVGGTRGTGVSAKITLHRISPESSLFEGSFVPSESGLLLLESPELGSRGRGEDRPALVRVERADLEMRSPEADHETLERIAAATGGKVLELDALQDEFSAIKDRRVQIPDDITEPLWDSRLALGLFVGMITLEWSLRKLFGLL